MRLFLFLLFLRCIGNAVIQLAGAAGAMAVYTTGRKGEEASTRVVDKTWVIQLGHDSEEWLPAVKGDMDVVIDTVGEGAWNLAHGAMNSTGKLVCIGNMSSVGSGLFGVGWSNHVMRSLKMINASYFMQRTTFYDLFQEVEENRSHYKSDLNKLFLMLREGIIDPPITRCVSLQKVPQSHNEIEKGGLTGAVVCLPFGFEFPETPIPTTKRKEEELMRYRQSSDNEGIIGKSNTTITSSGQDSWDSQIEANNDLNMSEICANPCSPGMGWAKQAFEKPKAVTGMNKMAKPKNIQPTKPFGKRQKGINDDDLKIETLKNPSSHGMGWVRRSFERQKPIIGRAKPKTFQPTKPLTKKNLKKKGKEKGNVGTTTAGRSGSLRTETSNPNGKSLTDQEDEASSEKSFMSAITELASNPTTSSLEGSISEQKYLMTQDGNSSSFSVSSLEKKERNISTPEESRGKKYSTEIQESRDTNEATKRQNGSEEGRSDSHEKSTEKSSTSIAQNSNKRGIIWKEGTISSHIASRKYESDTVTAASCTSNLTSITDDSSAILVLPFVQNVKKHGGAKSRLFRPWKSNDVTRGEELKSQEESHQIGIGVAKCVSGKALSLSHHSLNNRPEARKVRKKGLKKDAGLLAPIK